AAIVPTSIVGSLTYLANGQTDPIAALIVAAGAIGGALIGTMLLRRIPLTWLRWMFIALIVVVAVRMLVVAPERGDLVELSVPLAFGYFGVGIVMGIASGLFGIGGGVIAVPSFVALFGMSDLVAKGTSLLVMIPTGITGTLSNLRAHLVDLRAGLLVGVAATAAAIPGVAIALALTPRVSGILFAALLFVAATQLTIKAIAMQRKGVA
ncbi:MAG: Permease, partial [Glaciihabitans sp.]|nr:Permease [Glaciihabitans sp.]